MAKLYEDELRILAMAEPVILKMLRQREERILLALYGEFRNGNKNLGERVAEFVCVRDQINELTATATAHHNQVTKG